jgi:hypothetical protein
MGQYNENHKKKKIKEELKKCIESEEYFRENYVEVINPELYDDALPKIKEGFEGKVIITSTPLGNNYFFDLWEKSKKDSK